MIYYINTLFHKLYYNIRDIQIQFEFMSILRIEKIYKISK